MNTISIKKMMAPLKVSPLEVATLQLNEAQIKLLNQFRFVVQSLLGSPYDMNPFFWRKVKLLTREVEFKAGEISSLLSMLAKFRRSKNSESLIESASHVKSEEVCLKESAPGVTSEEEVTGRDGDMDEIVSKADFPFPNTAQIKQSRTSKFMSSRVDSIDTAHIQQSRTSESLIESGLYVKSEEVYPIESAPSVTSEEVIERDGDRDVIASRVDSPDTACIKQSRRQPRNSKRNKRFLKCVFLVLSVAVESCQAVFTQENGTTNMKHPIYLNLSIACSSLCFFMSLIEALHEARSRGVMWQHRSGFRGCFHYPGPHPRPFTEFSIYFGILCSSLQLILNVTTKVTHKNFVKFDYVPLLLSICYLVAAMVGYQEETSAEAIVNCKIHGYNATTAIVLAQKPPPKKLVFECPKCQLQDVPEFFVLPINSS